MSTAIASPLFDLIADEAAAESDLWREALLSREVRQPVPVFSPLGEPRFGVAVETIYEGYLAHYGRARLFAPPDDDAALLLGDYLYAHGLVRVAESGSVAAVHDLAELISLCAQLRADRRDGDAAAWAATAALLGGGGIEEARTALRRAGNAQSLEALARAAAGDDAIAQAFAAHARFAASELVR